MTRVRRSAQIKPLAGLVELDPCPACKEHAVLQLGRQITTLRALGVCIVTRRGSYLCFCARCGDGFSVTDAAARRLRRTARRGRCVPDSLLHQILRRENTS